MSALAAPARPRMLDPLRLREFRLLLTGFIFGQSMMPLQFVASIAWVRSITDEAEAAAMVGAIGAIRGIGMIGFGLFGGALADRFDRRRLLMVTQAIAFAANMGIAMLLWTGASDAGAIAIFFLFTIMASASHAVDGPTRQAITPEILGPRLTPAGIALNTAAMQLSLPISIFASGFLIDTLGHGTVFAISSLGHLGEILILAMMSYRTVFSAAHIAAQRASGESGPRQALRDIATGLRFARSKPVILWTVLVVVLMMGLIMPPTGTLGPLWVTTVVGATWSEFSYIAVFWGGGAMVMSLLLVGVSWIERKGMLTVTGVLTMAVGFVVFTLQPTALNAIVGNFLLGTGMSMAMVASAAIIAHEAPNEMRGRVMGLMFLGMGLAQFNGLPVGLAANQISMETLFPPMSWVVLVVLAAVIVLRPVVARARVPVALEAPTTAAPTMAVDDPAHNGANGVNGVGTVIARVAPNKPSASAGAAALRLR